MPALYTIGHSNHALEAFLALLRAHRIEVLVDVRSYPYSDYSPQFDAPALRQAVQNAGIRYLFLGRELGGRPEGEEYYDEDGHVLYGKVAGTPVFEQALARLADGIIRFRVAIVCSEEDPAACHRRLLIGRVLAGRGVSIEHIRGDGRLQTETELAAEVGPAVAADSQPYLFEELETTSWKSIPSVSPKRRQNSSSAF